MFNSYHILYFILGNSTEYINYNKIVYLLRASIVTIITAPLCCDTKFKKNMYVILMKGVSVWKGNYKNNMEKKI